VLAGKESSASPFIGRRWRSGRACEAERSAVSDGVCDEAGQKPARALVFDGVVATCAWSGMLVAGSVMHGGRSAAMRWMRQEGTVAQLSAVRACRILSEREWHREGHPEQEVGAWQSSR